MILYFKVRRLGGYLLFFVLLSSYGKAFKQKNNPTSQDGITTIGDPLRVPPRNPIKTTPKRLMRDQIGIREYTSAATAYDEFTASMANPTYVVGSKNLSHIRPWIGTSSPVVARNTQIFKFPVDTKWQSRIIQIFVFPHYIVGSFSYQARVIAGAGTVLSGGKHVFKTVNGNVKSEVWELRLRLDDPKKALELELSSSQTSGANSLHIDSYEIRQLSLANTTQAGLPIYRSLPGTSFTSSEVLSTVVLQKASTLEVSDEYGNKRWELPKPTNFSSLSGGMDFDQDGFIDLQVNLSRNEATSCGMNLMRTTGLSLMRGNNGQYLGLMTSLDKCWSQFNYSTVQWAPFSLLFGDSSLLMATPQYATQSWIYDFSSGNGTNTGYLFFPSTSSYDYYYQYDQLNPWGTGTSFVENSHLANGMIVNILGERRIVFFTSGRVMQFGTEKFSSGQLRADFPYISGGRTDIAGRNYGHIQTDPLAPHLMLLVGGDFNISVYNDKVQGAVTNSPWGGIERHVSIYNMVANYATDTFYSYAHDGGDGYKYVGRVISPGHTIFRVNDFNSRYAYNVFNPAGWSLVITPPGGTAAAKIIPNIFLWDMMDIDGDGLEEFFASPTLARTYLPTSETVIYKWDEATATLVRHQSFSGVIPKLISRFYEPSRKNTSGALYDVGVFERDSRLWIILYNPVTKQESALQINP